MGKKTLRNALVYYFKNFYPDTAPYRCFRLGGRSALGKSTGFAQSFFNLIGSDLNDYDRLVKSWL